MEDESNFKLGIFLGIFMLLALASLFYVGFYLNQPDIGFSPCVEDDVVVDGTDIQSIDTTNDIVTEEETEQTADEDEWDGFSDNDDSDDAITVNSEGDISDSDDSEEDSEWDYGYDDSDTGSVDTGTEDDDSEWDYGVDDDDSSSSGSYDGYGGSDDKEEKVSESGEEESELLLGPERSTIGKFLKLGVWILIGGGAFAGIAIFFYKLGKEKSGKRKKMLIWIAAGFIIVAGIMFFIGMYFGNSAIQFSPCIEDEGSDYEDPTFNVSYYVPENETVEGNVTIEVNDTIEIINETVEEDITDVVESNETVEVNITEEVVDVDLGLIVYYGFDSDSLSGATWIDTGKIGGAYDFDGVDDFISIEELDLDEYSIAFWFKADSPLSKTQSLIARGEDWTKDVAYSVIELNDNVNPGKVQLWYEEENDNDHYFATTSSIEVDRWYYFVVTRSSAGDVRVYLDNVLELERQDVESPGAVSDTPILIGARRNSPDKIQDYFDGMIDEVRIYDRVLSEGEIVELFIN